MSALRLSGFGALLALLTGLAGPAQAQTVVRYVHTDALGSVVALTDESRMVVERREYEPYGAQLTPAVQDGPGYTGHVQDAATGLTYMQQRYYDPGIGRFLSVDPVTANSSTGANFNRYKYAENNPYRFTDPDGRAPLGNTCGRLGVGSCSGTYEGSGVGSPSMRAGDNRPRSGNSGGGSNASSPLFMLPQNQGEGGYYNYGTPKNGAGQYGTGSALSTIFKVGHQRTLDGEAASFGVGNMSLKGGGPFPPHSSHRNGVDIDVRPMSVDGAQRGGVTWRSSAYDRAATQRLVDAFHATGQVRVIYFNDPQLSGVQPMRGHDDHLHVGVNP